ncbi:MAG: hypothetical protein J6A59_05430 [Lachnospiraceae bacterium]|nr:hypothetical protein [Lachnospiraceae bacterium]
MMSEKRTETVRHIVAIIFSFLLTLCLAAIFVLIGCKLGIFNEKIILSQLDKTDYSNKVHEAISSNAAEYMMPSGLPESILDGVISKADVKKDCRNAVTMSLKGQGYNPNFSGLEDRFNENVEKYMSDNGIVVEAGTEDGINELLEEIKAEYKRCLTFPFIKYFVKYQSAFNRFFIFAVALLMALTVLIGWMLMKMQRWPHRGVRYISYSTLATAIMLGVPVGALMVSGVHRRINISPEYLYDLITGVLGVDLIVFMVLVFVCIGIFVAELLYIEKLKKVATKLRKRSRRRE